MSDGFKVNISSVVLGGMKLVLFSSLVELAEIPSVVIVVELTLVSVRTVDDCVNVSVMLTSVAIELIIVDDLRISVEIEASMVLCTLDTDSLVSFSPSLVVLVLISLPSPPSSLVKCVSDVDDENGIDEEVKVTEADVENCSSPVLEDDDDDDDDDINREVVLKSVLD